MAIKTELRMLRRKCAAFKSRIEAAFFPCEKRIAEAREEFEDARSSLNNTIRRLRSLCDQDACEYHADSVVFIRPYPRTVAQKGHSR